MTDEQALYDLCPEDRFNRRLPAVDAWEAQKQRDDNRDRGIK